MGYADNFEDEIDIDKFSSFVAERGIEEDEMEEVYEKLNSERLKLLQKIHVNAPKTEVERRKELEKLYDLDLRPDWMKKKHF
jgi:myo-inositol catabolism protein IolC